MYVKHQAKPLGLQKLIEEAPSVGDPMTVANIKIKANTHTRTTSQKCAKSHGSGINMEIHGKRRCSVRSRQASRGGAPGAGGAGGGRDQQHKELH